MSRKLKIDLNSNKDRMFLLNKNYAEGARYVIPYLYLNYERYLADGLWIDDFSFLEDVLDKKIKTVEEIEQYIEAAIHSENHELYLILTKYKHKYLVPAQDEGRFEL